MTSPKTRVERMADDQAMINGTQKFFAKSAKLTVGSQVVTPAAIVKVFQNRIQTATAAVQADSARTAAVKADRDEQAQTGKFVSAYRRFVQASFEESPDTLAAFNLTAPKVGKPSAEVKAQAVTKREATRAARHTMGKKQRLEITGESVAAAANSSATPTPVSTPGNDAPQSQPAPAVVLPKPTA
jgi:hypothetical protein